MRRTNDRKNARFAYRIGNRHGYYSLLICLKGDHTYVPLSRTGFAQTLPVAFEFDSEPAAQAALATVKAILEAPDCYKRLAARRPAP
jgi:hypothetical protein